MGWSDESRERCRALVAELSELLAGGLESQPPPPEAWEGSAQASEEEAWFGYLVRQEEEEAYPSYEEEQKLNALSMDHLEEDYARVYGEYK